MTAKSNDVRRILDVFTEAKISVGSSNPQLFLKSFLDSSFQVESEDFSDDLDFDLDEEDEEGKNNDSDEEDEDLEGGEDEDSETPQRRQKGGGGRKRGGGRRRRSGGRKSSNAEPSTPTLSLPDSFNGDLYGDGVGGGSDLRFTAHKGSRQPASNSDQLEGMIETRGLRKEVARLVGLLQERNGGVRELVSVCPPFPYFFGGFICSLFLPTPPLFYLLI